MKTQTYHTMAASADGPPRSFVSLTSNTQYTDAEGFLHYVRGLFNNSATAGTIVAYMIDGSNKTLYIPAGHILPGFFTKITAGTLAVSDVLGVL